MLIVERNSLSLPNIPTPPTPCPSTHLVITAYRLLKKNSDNDKNTEIYILPGYLCKNT